MRFKKFYEATVVDIRATIGDVTKGRAKPVKSEFKSINKSGTATFYSNAVTTEDQSHWEQTIKPVKKFGKNVSLVKFREAWNGDVLVRCSCHDFRYRRGYGATEENFILGKKEKRPSNITNPPPTFPKGKICKHVENLLAVVKPNIPKMYKEFKASHQGE